MILADADFFIGLFHDKDIHHLKCIRILSEIKDDFVTSYDVIDEVATKMIYFGRKDITVKFIKYIFQKNIRVVYPSPHLFELTIEVLNCQKASHVSFTDCMNMAIAREWKIRHILSFDRIYEKNGFEVVK